MIGPEDDLYHERTDYPYWNESSWFSMSIPERGIEGYIYNWHRPNLGFCCVGPTFWDEHTTTIEDALYHDVHWIQHIPEGGFLDSRYPGGLTIERVVPGRSFRFTYDVADCAFDVTYEAITDPHELGPADPSMAVTFQRHFEQPGRMRGRLVLNGEEMAVDCLAMRDRSWGPRSMDQVQQGDYLWALGSEREGFHLISRAVGSKNEISGGFLLRDGVMADLVSGQSWTEGHRRSLQAERIFVEAEDALGRKLSAEGSTKNTMIWTMFPRLVCALGLVDWNVDGQHMWGEQQEYWPSTVARDLLRRGS